MNIRRFDTLLLMGFCALGAGGARLEAAAPAKPLGYLNFYTYAGDQRAGIQAGTATPDGSFYPKRAEGPYNGYPGADPGDDDTLPKGDNREGYNMVLKGYFYPPKTGKIQFAIASDDPGQLYFSTDENPANKTQIANESQWNPIRAFGGGADPSAPTRRTVVSTGSAPVPRPQNWSPFVNVAAGKAYYIEAVGTEGGGGDNLAVAFRFDGDPDFADGDKPIGGSLLSPFVLPAAPSLLGQPKDATVYAGSKATFSVAIDVPPSMTLTSIKWTKNGADVPDSNSASLTVTAAAADDGAKYKAIITTSGGNLTSSEAVLNVATFSNEFALGVVKFEAWTGIGGTAVAGLLDDAHYQDAPDDVRLLGGIDTPNGYADNYGARVSGFIIPAESGDFNFFIRSDDASQFFLSKTEKAPDPAVDTVVAEETGCCDAFHEADGSAETSQSPISLVAGKKYAFLAFVKEGGGGDYLQVAMRKVGDTTAAGALKPISGALIGANAKPTKGEPQITKQPVLPAKMEEGGSWSVSVDGIVVPAGYNFPVIVQWQKNGVNIPGASGKTFTIPKVTLGDTGKYRAVLSAPSGKTLNSVELDAVVISDKVAPTLASAQRSFASDTKVQVIFSEPVSAASANVAANYKIGNGVTVSAAALTSNPKIVELTTSAIAKGAKNTLTVGGVQDVYNNAIAAGSTIDVGLQKGVYLVTADPGPLTYAGDIAVQNHLLDRGFDVALARGSDVPDDGATAIGRDLIVQSSSLGSGTVEVAGIGKFRTLNIPAIEWEASSVDAFGFQEANANPGTTGAQTQVNIVDDKHPLAAGFPKGLVTTSSSETYSQGQPVGAHVVGTLASDPGQAVIFYYDKGEKGALDFVMPERRVFFFFQDNTAAAATDAGWALFDAAVNWSLRIDPPKPAPTLNNGLVAYWNFDGNLYDSVKDFHGTARGKTALGFVDGKAGFGQAIKLDGTDQFVEITGGNEDELEFPAGSMSVSGWFKVEAFDTNWQAIISKGEGTAYRVARRGDTGKIAYAGGVGEGADDIPAVNDGNWHHFVAVSDATGAKFGTAMYVDGVLRGINATKPVLAKNDLRLFIGENPGSRGREFKGQLDDIAIWNRVVSAEEVALLYNGGAGTALGKLSGVPTAVVTKATRSGNNVAIQWSPAGGTLESSPTLGAGAVWTPVGTANPATVAIGAGNNYYRIKK